MPHKAIWVKEDATQEIRTVPGGYKPSENELLIKTVCVAVNPGDWKHPEVFGAINTIEGFDVVGLVAEVGPGIASFHVGDKVLTFARGIGPGEFYNAVREGPDNLRALVAEWGGNQEYFLALAATSWKFDDAKLNEAQAAAIPLAACTAGDALYNKLQPSLPLPWAAPCDWPILIWGASSQVGLNAVQYARASGCRPIIAVASEKHRQYLQSLGAHCTFDYLDEEVLKRIKTSVPSGKHLLHAFDCVGVDLSLLEDVVEDGGSIVLALPPTRASSSHHVKMAVAGIIHDLESFRTDDFKWKDGKEPRDMTGAKRLRQLMVWTLDQAGSCYHPARIRRLKGRGMYDAFEAFDLMKSNAVSAEKVVWQMAETPDLAETKI